MKVTATVDVQNLPIKGLSKDYVVVRQVDGDLWYYGQYDSEAKAREVAIEIGNGLVIERKENING